jgi:hypothetical protein
MPITFACDCGRKLRVAEEHAGKRIRCPGCSGVVTVPEDEVPVVEAVAADSVTTAPSKPPRQAIAPKPAPPRPARKGPRPKLMAEHPDEDIDRDGRVVRRRRDSSSMTDKGVLAGLAMMGIAVVWGFGGLFLLHRFFIYPPILFVLGMISFIKGLVDGKG